MIRLLALYEWRIVRRDRRAWWALLSLAAMVLLSFAGLTVSTARADAEKRAVAVAERDRWLGQGEKDPHSAAHYSIFAFKPAAALAVLDSGVEPFVGQSVWLEAHHQNDMLDRPFQNASLLERAGLADPTSLILRFAPLVAFLLAFVAVAQDRERGTMRLAIGASIHPHVIVRAKALAIWAGMAICLLLPVGLLSLGLSLIGGSFNGDIFIRLLGWLALMAAYLGLAVAIGIVLSLRAADARLALVALVGLWIVFVLVLPRAASSATDRLRPLPSSQAVRQQMLDEAAAYWSAEDTERHKAALLRRYDVSRIEDVPNPRMAELDMVERHSHRVFDRILGGFYGRIAEQDRLFASLGLISPTIAVQSLSASLAGTDFTHHRNFINEAEQYRRALVNAMNGDGMAHSAHGTERHTNDNRLWSKIPTFSYEQPTLGSANATALPALLGLVVWLASGLWLLERTARRLRP